MNRKLRSPQFKSQVALEALKKQKTGNQLGAEYEIHQTQIGKRYKPSSVCSSVRLKGLSM